MANNVTSANHVHSFLFGAMRANVMLNSLYGLNIGLSESKLLIEFVSKADTVKVKFSDCSNII